MKKKILGCLLAGCLMVSLLPTAISTLTFGNAETSSSASFWGNWDYTASPNADINWGTLASSGETTDNTKNSVEKGGVTAEKQAVGTELSALTVGGVDAFVTAEGDGWRFDAASGTLTLSGAAITSEMEAGIAAVGDLTIVLVGEKAASVSGADYGVYVDGDLTIRGDALQVQSAADLGIGIYAAGNLLISECADLTAAGDYHGIYAGGTLTVSGSKVRGESSATIPEVVEAGNIARPFSIASNGEMYIEDKADVAVKSSGIGLGSINGKTSIVDSSVTANVFDTGLGGVVVSVSGSTVDITTKNTGIVSSTAVEIEESKIAISKTCSYEEWVELLSGGFLEGISSGIVSPGNGVFVTSGTVEINGDFLFGIWSESGEVSMDACDNIVVGNSRIKDPTAVMIAMQFNIPLAGIAAGGNVTLTDCGEVTAEGIYLGIASLGQQTVISNSAVTARGGAYGIVANTNLWLVDSPIQADAVWNAELLAAVNQPMGIAIQGIQGIKLSETHGVTGGEIGRYAEGGFETALDANGKPLASVTISPKSPDPELEITIVGSAAEKGAVITAPEGGWKEGTNTFTVSHTVPCAVAVSYDGGETYTRLTATAANGAYSFTAENMTADTILAVVVKGDTNGDGQLTNADITRLQAGYAGKVELTSLEAFAADVNASGDITNADITCLRAAYAGKKALDW